MSNLSPSGNGSGVPHNSTKEESIVDLPERSSDSHVPKTAIGDESSKQVEQAAVDGPHEMSIEELLNKIKGADGISVLFVPSTDGRRLVAVALNGLRDGRGSPDVPTPAVVMKEGMEEDKNHHKDLAGTNQEGFRTWLMFLASLAATVTFTAGHAPPGGFWSADDKANGYVAGTSVMRDKFFYRYLAFYYSNTAAFFVSLTIIVMLAKDKKGNDRASRMNDPIEHNRFVFIGLVATCILNLGSSYVTGSSHNPKEGMPSMVMFASVLIYLSLHWIKETIAWVKKIPSKIRQAWLKKDTNSMMLQVTVNAK
ncbi:uncharacterized protein [Lolium perenne]|uniref:uncharacterized protein n=1 Tax=Lolium perenne TaxID=4522 RepID=UPI003A9A36C1